MIINLKNCKKTGIERMSTNLDEVLADDFYEIYFDAQITGRRYGSVKKAIEATVTGQVNELYLKIAIHSHSLQERC
jgi:hypothetical protein